MDQREFDTIEARIAIADEHLARARARMEEPAVTINAAALSEALAVLDAAQTEHDALYERWLELAEKIGE